MSAMQNDACAVLPPQRVRGLRRDQSHHETINPLTLIESALYGPAATGASVICTFLGGRNRSGCSGRSARQAS